MADITNITPEQQAYFDAQIQKYLDDITIFKPMDYVKTKDAIVRIYAEMGQSAPEIVVACNPFEACKKAAAYDSASKTPKLMDIEDPKFGEKFKKNLLQIKDEYFLSVWWRFWDCFYQFGKYLGIEFDEKALQLIHDFTQHAYFIIPYEGICFVSEPPIRTYWNDNRQLHRDGGSCIEFKQPTEKDYIPGVSELKGKEFDKLKEEFGVYQLNGITVPKELAVTPAGSLRLEMYHEIQNADVKAEFVRKFGVERMIDLGTELDSYEKHDNEKWDESEYKVIDMSAIFPSISYAPHLYMKNQTTGIYHLEPVGPKVKNIKDALEFRYGGRTGDYDLLAIK